MIPILPEEPATAAAPEARALLDRLLGYLASQLEEPADFGLRGTPEHAVLMEDLQALRQRLAEGGPIPAGPAALVTPPAATATAFRPTCFRGMQGMAEPIEGLQPTPLYFPLPYNDEQVSILARLEHSAGVTVQGPPGTGKTHTIANIICHYLATGQRVLVTASGEAALRVLQSRIPAPLRALTVALLANDHDGIHPLETAIDAIQNQLAELNPALVRAQIDTAHQEIAHAHEALQAVDRALSVLAQQQLAPVCFGTEVLRMQTLAHGVRQDEARHGWFDDAVQAVPAHDIPLDAAERQALAAIRRQLGRDLVYLQAPPPPPDCIPAPRELLALHAMLVRLRELGALERSGALWPLRAPGAAVLTQARELATLVTQARSHAEDLAALDGGWAMILRARCRQDSFASERAALESLFADLEHLIDARLRFLKRPVTLPATALNSARVLQAIERSARTGKGFGALALGTGEARALLSEVRIAGLVPDGIDDWSHVQAYVRLHDEVASFVSRWNGFAHALSLPRLEGGLTTLRQIAQTGILARKAHALGSGIDAALVAAAARVFLQVPAEIREGRPEQLRTVERQLQMHLSRSDLLEASQRLSLLQAQVASTPGPLGEALRRFVELQLGDPGLSAEQVSALASRLSAELQRLHALSPALRQLKHLIDRIEGAAAPNFAARLRSVSVGKVGADPVLPADWEAAWQWARQRSFLLAHDQGQQALQLAQQRRDLERVLARHYRTLITQTAWLTLKDKASGQVMQALAGYASAIRRIGQGTGPNASRYRRDAREAMRGAASAIPCWIMRHLRVSESLPAELGHFDLVIVDEASQSDLAALPAILRGTKILVVGDDRQVSPDGGFMAAQRVTGLQQRYLRDQPFGSEMTPEKSLYDLAARVFATEQVMLREHFRSVPPIIAYANREFYRDAIIPLRLATPREAMDPPLLDRYLPHGQRDGQDCNPREAETIALEIASLLQDPLHQGRSIGVISLLGPAQAQCIDRAVRACCDPAALQATQFLCGDARAFQGSERDIVFLSLVVSPDNCRALSGRLFEQRFNVASTRARDRMILVRSVEPADLSERDLRRALLLHFADATQAALPMTVNPVERCETGFEREVCSALCERGFRVRPQVSIGRFRIDLVVEGEGQSRLAIACDGDELHAPQRWTQDMQTQRALERAGWTVWRCFAAAWTLHRDDMLSALMAELARQGISPQRVAG